MNYSWVSEAEGVVVDLGTLSKYPGYFYCLKEYPDVFEYDKRTQIRVLNCKRTLRIRILINRSRKRSHSESIVFQVSRLVSSLCSPQLLSVSKGKEPVNEKLMMLTSHFRYDGGVSS